MKTPTRNTLSMILITLLVAPVHGITHREWQGIVGIGAVGGALAGLMIYDAMREKKPEESMDEYHPHHHKPNKSNKATSFLSTITALAVGASTGALALAWWFWSYTPQARHEQAQGLIHLANLNQFIVQNVDLANPIAVQNAVRQVYVPNGQEFNRALWEMNAYQTNLERAQNLCVQANTDAADNPALQGAIAQTQVQIGELLNRVNARMQAIRNNPVYQVELAAAAQQMQDQEEIWRREFARQYFAHGYRWRWHFEWPRPVAVHYRVVAPNPVIVVPAPAPAPIVVQQAVHVPRPAPVVIPRPAPVVVQQPVVIAQAAPLHAPRSRPGAYPPAIAQRPIAPVAAAPGTNPAPAPLQRLIAQANDRERRNQPYHAPQVHVVPTQTAGMTPVQMARAMHQARRY